MKKTYFLSIYNLKIFVFSLFFCFFSSKKIYASEPATLYNGNILIANLAKEKAKKQAIINKKKSKKKPTFNEYFAKNYGQIFQNDYVKEKFSLLKNHYLKHKDRIAKKFKDKKRIKKQQYLWELLDLFLREPVIGLFLLIALLIGLGLWFLFSALGVAIAFEIIFLISLVITLIGYLIVIFMS